MSTITELKKQLSDLEPSIQQSEELVGKYVGGQNTVGNKVGDVLTDKAGKYEDIIARKNKAQQDFMGSGGLDDKAYSGIYDPSALSGLARQDFLNKYTGYNTQQDILNTVTGGAKELIQTGINAYTAEAEKAQQQLQALLEKRDRLMQEYDRAYQEEQDRKQLALQYAQMRGSGSSGGYGVEDVMAQWKILEGLANDAYKNQGVNPAQYMLNAIQSGGYGELTPAMASMYMSMYGSRIQTEGGQSSDPNVAKLEQQLARYSTDPLLKNSKDPIHLKKKKELEQQINAYYGGSKKTSQSVNNLSDISNLINQKGADNVFKINPQMTAYQKWRTEQPTQAKLADEFASNKDAGMTYEQAVQIYGTKGIPLNVIQEVYGRFY